MNVFKCPFCLLTVDDENTTFIMRIKLKLCVSCANYLIKRWQDQGVKFRYNDLRG
jgi:hypothetical protein